MKDRIQYVGVEPAGTDDSSVAFQRDEENAVGGRDEEIPERDSCQPDATNELVIGTAVRHTSAVHLHTRLPQHHFLLQHLVQQQLLLLVVVVVVQC